MGQRRLSRFDRFAPRSYIPHAQQAVHDEVGGGVDARELPFGAVAQRVEKRDGLGVVRRGVRRQLVESVRYALVERGTGPVVRLVHAIEGVRVELPELLHLSVHGAHVCIVGLLRVVDVEFGPAHMGVETEVDKNQGERPERHQRAKRRVEVLPLRVRFVPRGLGVLKVRRADFAASHQEVRRRPDLQEAQQKRDTAVEPVGLAEAAPHVHEDSEHGAHHEESREEEREGAEPLVDALLKQHSYCQHKGDQPGVELGDVVEVPSSWKEASNQGRGVGVEMAEGLRRLAAHHGEDRRDERPGGKPDSEQDRGGESCRPTRDPFPAGALALVKYHHRELEEDEQAAEEQRDVGHVPARHDVDGDQERKADDRALAKQLTASPGHERQQDEGVEPQGIAQVGRGPSGPGVAQGERERPGAL